MRVLLDENVPHDLIPQLAGHDVSTVQGFGWAGIKNGELLERARDAIDVVGLRWIANWKARFGTALV